MSRANVTIRNYWQEFQIKTEEIRANGESNSPILTIPLIADFKVSARSNFFEFMSIKAELRGTDKNFKLAETYQLFSCKVLNDFKYTFNLDFFLNEFILTKIENNRVQDLKLNLALQIQVGLYEPFTIPKPNGHYEDTYIITGFETPTAEINFYIEQSLWINKLLPRLGHNSYKLIELPGTNEIIPDEFAKSLVEFEEARKYFVKGDYDKTVAHCRSALDPFSGPVNLPKLKEFIKSKSEFTWATAVLEATELWLDKIIKATSSFTSKAHHAPSVGHFSRTDAEIVLLITTGIIAYIGKIEYPS